MPNYEQKRYDIHIRSGASLDQMTQANLGTIRRDVKYGDAYLVHVIDGVEYKTKITTLRGDYQKPDGTIGNKLRLWERSDFRPRSEDLLQERLYCIQWMRPKKNGKGDEYEFRTVTEDDLHREQVVENFVATNLSQWQEKGLVPDMKIEVGGPPRYQGLDLVRARGWTYWHHLFNARHLLMAHLYQRSSIAGLKFGFSRVLNQSSRLSRWNSALGNDKVETVFDNQALNTIYNYGARGSSYAGDLVLADFKSFPITISAAQVVCKPAFNHELS